MNRDAAELIEKKNNFLFPCVFHFYKDPPVIERGEMQYLFDSNGTRYVDLYAGVSVVQCGHCNPFVVDAVERQMERLQHTTTIYLTRPILDLAERLAAVTPGDLKRTFFVNSGSEANEGACLLASLVRRNSEFIALRGGLHGRTKLTMSLTGLGMWRTDPNPVGGISFLRAPKCLGCSENPDTCDLACASELNDLIASSTSGSPAALIAEPIQGNGGIVVPPEGYFKRIGEILDSHGILLILDEVQTGFGRTGRFFACEHEGVVPQILTVAKGLGNGTPIGAFIAGDEIASHYTRPGASTTGGNAVSAAAGVAVLDYMEKENLPQRSAELGGLLKARLEEMAHDRPWIAEVRGRGLMLGMELIADGGAPDADRTDIILEELKDRGFLAGKTGPGRNVLTFMPPLVIENENIDALCNALEDILAGQRPG